MTARDEAVEAAMNEDDGHTFTFHPPGINDIGCTCGEPLPDAVDSLTEWMRRHKAEKQLDAALPVLLDGLDRAALVEVIADRIGGDHHFIREDMPDVRQRARESIAGPVADAAIAHLRDEFGGAS